MLLLLQCASPPPDDDTASVAFPDTVAPAPLYPAHLDTALTYVGTQELGNNAGPDVERFLASVGLRAGNPYCAAFVSYSLDAGRVSVPATRSALARDFALPTSIPARVVLRGAWTPPPGTIVVFRKGNGPFGHLALVVLWARVDGETVEANTSSGTYGNQRDGDGVWTRSRKIEPGSYFRITDFTEVIP